MKQKLIVLMLIAVAITGCFEKSKSMAETSAVTVEEYVVEAFLNGTWGRIPKENYSGKPIPKEKFTWGEGEFNPGFYAFDIKRGIIFTDDGVRFLAGIKELEPNVFEIGLNKPFDHKPTEEEIAAHKAAGPDEIIVVHFINKNKFWMELLKGFVLDKEFDAKRNLYYRYSGPGTAIAP